MIAEKWPWPPDAIDNLPLDDFFEHADMAHAIFEEQAKKNAPPMKR